MRTLLFGTHPTKRMDRPAYRSSAHGYPMLNFPPLAILCLIRIGVRFQQRLHSHSQRRSFPRRATWNGSGQDGSGLAPLLEIALDRGSRYLEEIDDLCSRCPFVNCTKYSLPSVLRICSHASIVSPGSFFPQVTGVHKLPLQRYAETLSHLKTEMSTLSRFSHRPLFSKLEVQSFHGF